MRVTNHESDAEKRVFVGYLAVVVSIILIAVKFAAVEIYNSNSGAVGVNTSLSFFDKVALFALNSEALGITLVAAALLLMLETKTESRQMTIAIVITGIVSAILLLTEVVGIANAIFGNNGIVDNALSGSDNNVHQIIDYLATAVLALGAFALTWPVLTNLKLADTDVEAESQSPEAE